jgi:hypothetical protein
LTVPLAPAYLRTCSAIFAFAIATPSSWADNGRLAS